MEIHPFLAMVDRVFDATTADDEVKTVVEGGRRTLNGRLPSVILQHLAIPGEEGNRAESLQEDIKGLTQQVNDLLVEKTDLEAQIAELKERLEQIGSVSGPAENGFYTMEQFLAVLTVKLRRSYGWRIDYVCASQETEGCRPVGNETVQKWQNSGKVPDWAVDQIHKLTFRKRRVGTSGAPWSDDNKIYLTELYQSDPGQSNLLLAQLCEAHFGRSINEASIKSAVDRLRKRGQLPLKRPSRKQ